MFQFQGAKRLDQALLFNLGKTWQKTLSLSLLRVNLLKVSILVKKKKKKKLQTVRKMVLLCYFSDGAYGGLICGVYWRGNKVSLIGALVPGGLEIFGKNQNLRPNFKFVRFPFIFEKNNFQL